VILKVEVTFGGESFEGDKWAIGRRGCAMGEKM